MADPTLFGWFTVVAYFVAAGLSAACAWQAERIFSDGHSRQHRLIWSVLALGLLFLGINKQLDLQTPFIALAKRIAYAGGWYDLGQRAQVLFITAMIAASLLLLGWLVIRMRHLWRSYWLLLLGLLALGRFIVVRAATFFGVPLPDLSRFTGGVRINCLLEVLGAALIALAALLNLLKKRNVPFER